MPGLIPRPFIDEVINRTDIVELIDGYVPLKKSGSNYMACCPFHNEKTPSFNVVAKKQFYHCFGCGASGNAISFLMSYLNQDFVETVENLAARLGMQVPREGGHDGPRPSPSLYDLLKKISLFYCNQLKTNGEQAITYLKGRQLTGQIVKEYEIGYAPSGWHTLESQFKSHQKDMITTGMLIQKDDGNTYDRYRHRITFPIHDRNGRIIGFGGRAIDSDQKPKYLNSPETIIFQKSRELYGLHQAIQHQSPLPFVIVVEGYMDVIALAQFGVKNAVATLGTATSTSHIQLLNKHTTKIVFCFDGDEAGQKAAWRALESTLPVLNSGIETQFCFLPEGQDPDSYVQAFGAEAFHQFLNQSQSFKQFFFSELKKGIELSTFSGKSQLINVIKPYLLKMNEGPFQQLVINELSRMTHIDADKIGQMLSDQTDDIIFDNKFNITRTPVRIALALLIQNPEIYQKAQEEIAQLEIAEPMLVQLMQQIDTQPETSTASLIENWRDTKVFDALNKLAAWDHKVPEEALENEFVDTLKFLNKQQEEKKIADLLEKSRNQGLTQEDRVKLQELLKKKHLKQLEDQAK